jgi:hypothetical protein
VGGASEKDEKGGGFSRRGEEKESRNNFLFFPLSLNGFRGVGDLLP